MSRTDLYQLLNQETGRIDNLAVSKRQEKIITGFTSDSPPRALINRKPYRVFNSNDYLGLRHHPKLHAAEITAAQKYGTGPGAVRFISGSLQIHRDLEKKLARFHHRDDAIIFSSAFAANLAAISCLIKGQSKDSLVDADTLVISDELNHRSIVDGIRLANLPDANRMIFPHFNILKLEEILSANISNFKRVLVVTDGVFSMLGEYQDLGRMRQVIDHFDSQYPLGVLMYVDDCHGIGVLGKTGRGVEELYGVQSDILVGTLGKAFGADGGYVTADQPVIDYLRESAATYIYSNSISPGTAGAALAAVSLVDSPAGAKLLHRLNENILLFKRLMAETKTVFAADSVHPIQPLLLADTSKAKQLEKHLFDRGILVTAITYPIVPKGRDEIRVQLSAVHTRDDLTNFASVCQKFSQ